MFTGIIEGMASLIKLNKVGTNIQAFFQSSILKELKIDQSIAHNGVCLTIDDILDDCYRVTIIEESLLKSNFNQLKIGDLVNIERAMKLGDRLDGHIVQGHVDGTATCTNIENKNGSWYLFFKHSHPKFRTIEKGSIAINGISLTVVESEINQFSVSIIPYTWQETNLQFLKVGDLVNIEFDMLGKYVQTMVLDRNIQTQ